MLVLQRKKGEDIWIGESIKICVVDLKPGRAHIGVLAPSWLKVQRSEIMVATPDEARLGDGELAYALGVEAGAIIQTMKTTKQDRFVAEVNESNMVRVDGFARALGWDMVIQSPGSVAFVRRQS